MPNYHKFMKHFILNKNKLAEGKTIKIIKDVSHYIQKVVNG